MKRAGIITLSLISLCLLAVATYTFLYLGSRDARDSEASRTIGQANEKAVYTDISGAAFDFSAYEGQVRVVNVWASWTPFSERELTDLVALSKEYDPSEVAFIALNRGETKERAAAYLEKLPEQGNVRFVSDENDGFYDRIGGRAMPETVIFDENGDIVVHKRGHMSLSEMRNYTEDALHEEEH